MLGHNALSTRPLVGSCFSTDALVLWRTALSTCPWVGACFSPELLFGALVVQCL